MTSQNAADPSGGKGARQLWPRLTLLAIWAVVTLWLALQHAFWRDEVRALSIALQGDGIAEMLRLMQGEGHPALWYLLLRVAHDIVPVREVLPAIAWLAAAGAMAILALRSPLRLVTIALIMFGGFGLYEYAVSARNYGLSLLFLFAIAALYGRHRDRSILIGLLLAGLCNTNVHAAFLAAGLLGFWLVELVSEEGLRWTRKHAIFAANAVVATVGAALCFVTIYPPAHDAAVMVHPDGIGAATILAALASPADAFAPLLPFDWNALTAALLTLLVVGAVLGLARAPAALLAALAVMIADQLFFGLVYPGDYRHVALFPAFLATLYWLVADGRGGRWPQGIGEKTGRIARIGGVAFTALLALQLLHSGTRLRLAAEGIPQSRAHDLAALLASEGLTDATLIANADVILEPLPYYAGNPIWLIREGRIGNVTRFTRDARIHLDLDTMIAEAEARRAATGRPVVIVMQPRLDPGMPPAIRREGYGGSFAMPADQIDRFLARTRRLARFGPAASDESYDVYLLGDG